MSNFTNSLQTCTRNNTSKQHVKLSNMYDEFLKHIFFKDFSVLSHVYIHTMCVAWCLWRSEEGVESLGTGVTGGCEPPCEC